MLRVRSQLLKGYSVAVVTTLSAVLVRFLLWPALGQDAPMLLFVLPVMFSSWYAGFQAGLLSTGLSAILSTYFFVRPYFSFELVRAGDGVRLLIFISIGVIISGLNRALRQSKYRAEQTSQSLKEQEAQYRLLVDSVTDYAIFSLDQTGLITSWNSGATKLTRLTAADTLGQPITRFALCSAAGLTAVATTGHYEYEGWYHRQDGSQFWATVTLTALQGELNQQGFSVIIRDTTQHQQNEQALQESYALLQGVMEGTTDAVYVKDQAGQYQFVNSTTAKIFGKSKAEIIGRDDRQLISLPEAIALQQIDQLVMTSGCSQTIEESVLVAGKARTYLSTKDPYRDARGNILGVIGVSRDITERKQVYQQLQHSAQRLAALYAIDTAILQDEPPPVIAQIALTRLQQLIPYQQAVVLLLDQQTQQAQVLAGKISTWVAGSQLVYSTAQLATLEQSQPLYLTGETLLTQCPVVLEPLVAAGYQSILSLALRVNRLFFGNLILAAAQQSAFTAEHQAVASEIANQLAIAFQQAQLRQQVQQYTSELEQRVAERTQALQEANEGLETFNYSASHDLRAPLRVMQGLTQALLEDYREQLDTTGQQYLQEVARSANQADQLVTNLLEYGRLTRADIALGPINLSQLVVNVVTQLQDQHHEDQAQITIDHPLPDVLGHPAVLEQVILNLITNAIKFMPPDCQPQVRIWATVEQNWVRLWIADNGIGIVQEHQQRIFQAFERLHTATTYPGTGIGLAIVRKGIERMGGQVGVESQPGQGSQFWLTLSRVTG